ncbi:MAG: hypothetical protein H7Y39_01910 [Nitrospiraceae bacterium]|nr:hypothetical protein [Nitrospiraceae bacterium]
MRINGIPPEKSHSYMDLFHLLPETVRGDGDVDWPAVRQAFADIGYAGSAIAELEQGDETYLRDVSRRMDRLLLG